jgi:hypothetical protein
MQHYQIPHWSVPTIQHQSVPRVEHWSVPKVGDYQIPEADPTPSMSLQLPTLASYLSGGMQSVKPLSLGDSIRNWTALKGSTQTDESGPQSLAQYLLGGKRKKGQQYKQPQNTYDENGNLQPTNFMENYNYYRQQRNPQVQSKPEQQGSLADYFQNMTSNY